MERKVAAHLGVKEVLEIFLVLAVSYFLNLASLPLFHALVEIASIIVAFSIFLVAWNSRRFHDYDFLLFLGIAFLFIALIDLIHLFTSPEFAFMKSYDINLSQQLRLAGRFLESASFVLAFSFIDRKIRVRSVFLGYCAAFLFLTLSIFYWRSFPAAFSFETGATPFKRLGDYASVLLFLVSLGILLKKRGKLHPLLTEVFFLAISFQAAGIAIHTPYTDNYSLTNLFGLSFRMVAFFLFYKAVVEIGLMHPYSLLFRRLIEDVARRKKVEEKLKTYQDNLEDKVESQAIDLKRANRKLTLDKKQLIESYRHLGIVNRKFSILLDLYRAPLGKKSRQGILNYILSTILNISRARAGYLYSYDEKGKIFHLLLDQNTKKTGRGSASTIPAKASAVLRSLVKDPQRLCGNGGENLLALPGNQSRAEYFIALPLKNNRKLAGLIFLEFEKKMNISSQEFDFFDIFSIIASQTLFNNHILKNSGE